MKRVINIVLGMILSAILLIIIYKKFLPQVNQIEEKSVVTAVEKPIKIGFSLGTLKEERWFKDRDILMSKVQSLGAEIYVHNANNDDLDQIKQVQSLIDEGIDVLVLVPNDMQKSSQAVQIAKKAGVKVISYDRLVMDEDIDLYISFDNEKVGSLMAQALLEKQATGNYLIINGAPTDHNTTMIKTGYDSILSPYVKRGEITIIEEAWAGNWMREEAFDVTDQLLNDRIIINAILSGNDSLADGAVEALSQRRLATGVAVVGQDADLAACQRIVNGLQLMTVYKPIDKLATETAEIAVKMARGEQIDITKTIEVNGKMVPYFVLEPLGIYKDNMEEIIIRDGFHRRNEIYQEE